MTKKKTTTGHCFFFCTKGSGLVQPLSQLFHPGVALSSSILAAQLKVLQTMQHFLHFGSFLVPVKSRCSPPTFPPPMCWDGLVRKEEAVCRDGHQCRDRHVALCSAMVLWRSDRQSRSPPSIFFPSFLPWPSHSLPFKVGWEVGGSQPGAPGGEVSPSGLSLWHQPGEPAQPQETRSGPRR